MNIKKQLFVASALMLSALPMQAQAAVATGTLNVSATTITATAVVNVAAPVSFGAVVDTATAAANSSFSVTVTNGLPYSIALDGGANFNVATNKSFLKDAGGLNAREYILYQDVANTKIWGPAGLGLTALTGTGVAQTYNTYGQLLAAVGTTGAVTDVVTITVTY